MAIVALAIVGSACVPKSKVSTTPKSGADLVVLLPDPGKATAGHAVVSNDHGTVALTEPRAGVRVSSDAAPQPLTLDAKEVDRLFGDALASLPPAPEHFTLFFRFDSEELTDESRRLVLDVVKAVKQRPVPDVLAIGHTDTTGSSRKNIELGLRRANTVKTILVEAGLASTSIAVRSHGEADLLVHTSNGVFEARNRRVELTVR